MFLSHPEKLSLESAQRAIPRARPAIPEIASELVFFSEVSFGENFNSPLHTILERRASFRDLSGELPFEAIKRILNTLTISSANGKGRPGVPTTGGLDAQKLLCIITNVSDLYPGVYEVNWGTSVLQQLEGLTPESKFFLSKVSSYLGLSDTFPAAVMLCLADWQRISGVYEGGTLVSGVLDAGVILANLYLSSSEAGVGCCAVSALDDGPFLDSLGLNNERWGHVVTFALGNPA